MRSRRLFLQRIAGGIVAGAVLAKLPTALIPEKVRTYAACEFLRTTYNRWTAARMAAGYSMAIAFPHRMYAGRELYEAYESELTAVMRLCATHDHGEPCGLMFKGAWLTAEGSGWTVRCESPEARVA